MRKEYENNISEGYVASELIAGNLDSLLYKLLNHNEDNQKSNAFYKVIHYIINEIGSDNQILAGLSTAIQENNKNELAVKEAASYLALDGVERRLHSGEFDQAISLILMYLALVNHKVQPDKICVLPITSLDKYITSNSLCAITSLSEEKGEVKSLMYNEKTEQIVSIIQKVEAISSPICELNDVCGRGGSDIIVDKKSNILLHDLAVKENFESYSMRKHSVLAHSNMNGIFHKFEATTEAPPHINVCAADPQNYYHFMFNVLSKIIVSNAYGINSNVPILIDNNYLNIPQYKEAVSIVNSNNRALLTVPYGCGFDTKSMYYIPPACLFPSNLKKGRIRDNGVSDFSVMPEIIRIVRDEFLKKINATPVRRRKIFVIRSANATIRCLNEEEIAEYLNSIGFEIISPEKISFSEQVSIFSQCDIFIGVSGAAFTNTIFMPEGSRAICLTDNISLAHAAPAKAAGVEFIHVIGNNINKIDHYSNPFTIPIDSIKGVLSML